MTSRILRSAVAFLAGLALAGVPTLAQGKGRDRDNEKERDELRIEDRDRGDFDRGRDDRRVRLVRRHHPVVLEDRDDDDRDFDRDDLRVRKIRHPRHRVRILDRDDFDRHRDFDRDDVRVAPVVVSRHSAGPFHRPPGWDRGRKVGWGGSDVPPGRP